MKKIALLLLLSNLAIAANFEGLDIISDKEISIDTKSNAFVLIFMSESCPCSESHFEYLNELKAKNKNVQFIGIHSNKNSALKDIKAYFSEFTINFPLINDQKLVYANKYKALKTPHTFLFNKNEKLVFQGAATNSRTPSRASKFYLSDAIKSMSENKDPQIKHAKAIGCYIER